MDHTSKQESLALRLAPLFIAMFCGFLTICIPLPVIPLQVHETMGFGTAVAGLAVGIQSFATIVTRPYAGRMVDGAGAKITLIRGLVVSAIAGLAYLFSVALSSALLSLFILLAGRLVLGIGESMLVTGILNWAVTRAGPGKSGQAMSWNGMAQYLALAAGAPVGFAVFRTAGFAAVAWAAALVPMVALAVVLPLAAPPVLGGTRMPFTVVLRQIWRPGIALMLAGIGFASVSTFASLDFAAKGWSGAGYALMCFGLCFAAVRLVIGGLPDRLGGRSVAVLTMVVEAIAQLILWKASTPELAYLGAGLTGAGCSLVYPALGVEAVRRVEPANRGVALGAFSAFQDLAFGSTGPVLGTLASLGGAPIVFLFGSLTAAMGAMASLMIQPPKADHK